jgi:hypothetical protein
VAQAVAAGEGAGTAGLVMSRFDRKPVYPKGSWATDSPLPPVPKLPPPPRRGEQFVKATQAYTEAWKAWDATMVVTDGDRVLADRVFNSTFDKRRKDTP